MKGRVIGALFLAVMALAGGCSAERDNKYDPKSSNYLTVMVSFDSQGGSAVASQTTGYNRCTTAPAEPIRTGYAFGGWYRDSAYTEKWKFSTDRVDGDITLYARWLANPCTVTYNSMGGSSVDPETVEYGDLLAVPSESTRTGYTFDAWYREPACVTPWVFASDTMTGDITLYAGWTINTYTLTYTAGANGSISGSTTQVVNYGSSGSAVTAVANTGYHFDQWSDGVLTATRTDSSVSADISVSASFAINTYTLTYTAGANGSLSGSTTQVVNYGSSGSAVTAVANTGYHFVQWSDGVLTATRTDSSVSADISVTASFAINQYTVTFDSQGGSAVSSQTVNHGGLVSVPTAPTWSGHVFVGWYKEASCTNQWVFGTDTVTTDTTLYAKWISSTKLVASDGAASDTFGRSVAVSEDGSVVAVGSPYAAISGKNQQGAAYVCRWNGSSWVQHKLSASDGAATDFLGASIAVSGNGNVVVAGADYADGANTNQGAAWVFRWNGSSYVQTQKLLASDGQNSDFLGMGVAVSYDGSRIVAGAWYGDGVVTDSGAAYVYNWNGTSYDQIQKLTASDGAAGDLFGITVAMSSDGTMILVGSPNSDVTYANQGAGYVYHWNGSSYDQIQKLTASDAAASDGLGVRVAISADYSTLVMGAHGADVAYADQGAAYVYHWNGSSYVQLQKLTASDGAASDGFGGNVSVSSDGSVVVVGASGDDVTYTDQGSAYVYTWNGSSYDQTLKLVASDGAGGDGFGAWVAVSEDGLTVVVGSPNDDISYSDQGSVWIFEF